MLRWIPLISLLLSTSPASALIYGRDDRQEAAATWARPFSGAVLLMTSKTFIVDEGDPDFVKLDFLAASGDGSFISLCPGQKFAEQATAGINCSGFLIAPDLLVTAGHCVVPYGKTEGRSTPTCDDFIWIADFAYGADGKAPALERWPRRKIFECAEVIEGQNPDFSSTEFKPPVFGDDYALVRLKTPVTDRAPLKMSSDFRIQNEIYILGYPLGLPQKLAGPARVTDGNFAKFYATNLDAFMGNSGSPVLGRDGLVQGILVRGYPDDFVTDQKECYTMNACDEDGLRCTENSDFFANGEHVQRLDVIHAALAKYQGRPAPSVKNAPAMIALAPLFRRPLAAGLMSPASAKSLAGARPRTFIDPNRAPQFTPIKEGRGR